MEKFGTFWVQCGQIFFCEILASIAQSKIAQSRSSVFGTNFYDAGNAGFFN
ncbi:hypothetical protein WN55_11112 [Dufourea novaeangliae]|uniref:Uncharacterized protein n=1 Tax=Dufourea novaeangliae TaxID=178035 RepID=A0A154PBT5_DUFNO|nr:hypothetical protein WN55_11112 [Dufourea novaeangliae]